MTKPGRTAASPYRYDRAAIRLLLEREGLEAARARWPRFAVDPIARVMGLTQAYHSRQTLLTPEQIARLGTAPDSVLAGEWGLSYSTVALQRKWLGIPTCARSWRRRCAQERLRQITDAELLSPLVDLSLRTKIAPINLAAERRRRGLWLPRGKRGRPSHVPPLTERRRVALLALRQAFPAITLEELGEVFQVTCERVRQIEVAMSIEQQPIAETA